MNIHDSINIAGPMHLVLLAEGLVLRQTRCNGMKQFLLRGSRKRHLGRHGDTADDVLSGHSATMKLLLLGPLTEFNGSFLKIL
jgi:hypothetical protein